MKRLHTAFFLFVSIFFLSVSQTWAQDANLGVQSALEKVVAAQTASASGAAQLGPHFRAGDSVVISDTYNGDLYAAGGNVQVIGTVDGDLLAAGGSILIDGTITQDLRIAGGNIVINGTIEKDVTVMGGNITFTPQSKVMGSVIVFGGSVSMQGIVDGNVYGGTGNMNASGSIGNNFTVDSGSLTISPGASISGMLTARFSESSSIDESVSVAGSSDVQQVRESNPEEPTALANQEEEKSWLEAGLLAKYIFGSLMAIVGGLLMLYVFPSVLLNSADTIEKTPWSAAGWGVVTLLIAPLLFVLLLVTVVGIPIAFILLFFWIIGLIVATWVSSFVVGRWLYSQFQLSWMKTNWVQLTVGVLLLQLVVMIPVIGWLVSMAALFLGLGSVFIWLKTTIKVDKKF